MVVSAILLWIIKCLIYLIWQQILVKKVSDPIVPMLAIVSLANTILHVLVILFLLPAIALDQAIQGQHVVTVRLSIAHNISIDVFILKELLIDVIGLNLNR